MTEKMYDNLQEKYISNAFQILKICKAFSNFDFISTIRKKCTRFCNFENKVLKKFSLTSQAEHPNSFIYVLI